MNCLDYLRGMSPSSIRIRASFRSARFNASASMMRVAKRAYTSIRIVAMVSIVAGLSSRYVRWIAFYGGTPVRPEAHRGELPKYSH